MMVYVLYLEFLHVGEANKKKPEYFFSPCESRCVLHYEQEGENGLYLSYPSD